MSNSLDPDQARRIVGPDLGPNCLPRLSADDTGRQRVKQMLDLHVVSNYLLFILEEQSDQMSALLGILNSKVTVFILRVVYLGYLNFFK